MERKISYNNVMWLTSIPMNRYSSSSVPCATKRDICMEGSVLEQTHRF